MAEPLGLVLPAQRPSSANRRRVAVRLTAPAASLTQQQVADALGIPQPQYASYEVGRRRVPVSLLPGLARLFSTSIDVLIGEGGMPEPGTPAPRRSKPGPPSKLERQLDAVAQLPRSRQKFISDMLDTVLAQHHGQEAAPAS